jgi:hypothetical protein
MLSPHGRSVEGEQGMSGPGPSIDWIDKLARRPHVEGLCELVRRYAVTVDGVEIGVDVWWYPRQNHYVGVTDHAIKTRALPAPYRRSQPLASPEHAAYDAVAGLLALYNDAESPGCFVKVG